MNIFCRSMNESKFHLVLFKPSTHLFQWSEIRLDDLLLRRSVECKFCQTYESYLPRGGGGGAISHTFS